MYSGPRTQRPNFGKEIWREARSHWKNRVLGAGGLRDLSLTGVEGCERPNGASGGGVLRAAGSALRRRPGAAEGDSRSQQIGHRSQDGPERGRGAQGPGASHPGTEQGQNRQEEKLCATEAPPECKDHPGGEACGPGCGLQDALCFPRRGPGGWRFQQRWMHLRPLCLKNGNWGCSPVRPLRIELFLSLTCPTHPSGQCPSLHPSPPKLVPNPRLF